MAKDGFLQVRPFRAPIWGHSGGGDTQVGCSSTRKRTVVRSIRWVSTRFGEGGGQLDRRRARGVLSPCVREAKVRTERFLRGKLILEHDLFFSCEGHEAAATGQASSDGFQEFTGLRTAEYWLPLRLHQLKALTAIDLGITVLLISA